MLCTCAYAPVAHHSGWCTPNPDFPTTNQEWRVFEEITLADWARR